MVKHRLQISFAMLVSPYPRTSRWLLVVPALFLAVFLALPFGVIVYRGAGVDAFIDSITNSNLQRVAWFTFWQTVISTMLTVVFALPVTYIVSRFRFRGRNVLLALITAPFLLPTVVVGTSLLALLPQQLHYTAFSIIAAHVLFNVAVVVRVVMPSWAHISPELAYAAHTLGASTFRTFRTITFPLIRPALGFAATAVALFCFTSFGAVRILGGPAFSTLETEIYFRAVQLGDLNGAVAISLIQTLFLAIVLYAWMRWTRTSSTLAVVHSHAASPSRTSHWVAISAVGFVFGAAVIAPLIAVAYRSATGWSQVWSRSTASSLFVSVRYAVISAIIATLIGSCIALAVAYSTTSARVIELITSLPLMISAVTIGLGVLITFDTSPYAFRSAWWITPVAHSLIAIPLVVRIVLPLMRTIPQSLRDAAATLGSGPRVQWLTVDLPLMRRGIATALALSAAVSIGEFGATSFLTRQSNETLPVTIARLLSRPGESQHAQAYALATLFFVFSIGAVFIAEVTRNKRNTTS